MKVRMRKNGGWKIVDLPEKKARALIADGRAYAVPEVECGMRTPNGRKAVLDRTPQKRS